MKGPFERLLLGLLMVFVFLPGAAGGLAQESDKKLTGAVEEAQDAGIPAATVNRLMILGYEKQFQPAAMASLLRLLAQAHNEEIPLQPMISKIEEGIIKQARPSAIEQVVSKKLDDYRRTRSLMTGYLNRTDQKGASIPAEYFIRLTESLYCGLAMKDLERVLKEAPAAPLATITRGVDILASLRQIGFDSALSEQIVFAGIRQNYFTSRPNDFIRVIALAKKKGNSDRKIAAAALELIESKGALEHFSARLEVTAQDLNKCGPQFAVDIEKGAGSDEKISGAANGAEKAAGRGNSAGAIGSDR